MREERFFLSGLESLDHGAMGIHSLAGDQSSFPEAATLTVVALAKKGRQLFRPLRKRYFASGGCLYPLLDCRSLLPPLIMPPAVLFQPDGHVLSSACWRRDDGGDPESDFALDSSIAHNEIIIFGGERRPDAENEDLMMLLLFPVLLPSSSSSSSSTTACPPHSSSRSSFWSVVRCAGGHVPRSPDEERVSYGLFRVAI